MSNSVINKSKAEIPTIDVAMVAIETQDGKMFGFDTASVVEVEPQLSEQDAVQLVIKQILRAQKKASSTLTGNQITLTDNVFNPELVLVLQGGQIEYDTENPDKIVGYTPPLAGSADKGEIFKLHLWSSIYNAAGVITGYEEIIYPNCEGTPVAMNSEDDTFRAPEYTINSAPDTGEPPYWVKWVESLPFVNTVTNETATVESSTQLGKALTELGTFKVDANGTITGEANKITGWTEFSSIAAEQDGYYVALNFNPWEGNTFRIDRTTGKGKEVAFNGDGIAICRLGGTIEEAKTAQYIVVKTDKGEQGFAINVTFKE